MTRNVPNFNVTNYFEFLISRSSARKKNPPVAEFLLNFLFRQLTDYYSRDRRKKKRTVINSRKSRNSENSIRNRKKQKNVAAIKMVEIDRKFEGKEQKMEHRADQLENKNEEKQGEQTGNQQTD